MSHHNIFDINTFDINNLRFGDLEAKEDKGGKHHVMKLSYSVNGIYSDFMLKGPEFECKYGIAENKQFNKEEASDYKGYQLALTFDVNNPDHRKFMEILDSIDAQTIKKLVEIKKGNKAFAGSWATFGPNSLNNLYNKMIYRKVDGDGNLVEGSSPALYLKVTKDGKYATAFHTPRHPQTGISMRIEFERLFGKRFSIRPMIAFSNVAKRGKTRVNERLYSGIVTSISEEASPDLFGDDLNIVTDESVFKALGSPMQSGIPEVSADPESALNEVPPIPEVEHESS